MSAEWIKRSERTPKAKDYPVWLFATGSPVHTHIPLLLAYTHWMPAERTPAPPPPQRKSFLELDKEAFRQSYMSSSGRELCLSCYHEGRQSLRAQVRAVFEKDPCNKGAAIRALVDEESP